jgi:hypothetical protein
MTIEILEELKKEFKIIKEKILNNQIVQNNLDKNRTQSKLLLETLKGAYSEIIVLKKLKELKNNSNFNIISYNDIRIDDNKHPDMFDFLLLPNDIEQKLIISELEKIMPTINKKSANYNELYNLKEKYNLKTIEVKSSNKFRHINSQSYICYALNKNDYLKYKNTGTKVFSIEELNQPNILLSMSEYLKRLYNTNEPEKYIKQYQKDNMFFLKDILFNILWKNKTIPQEFLDMNVKDISFNHILKFLPTEIELLGFTTKEQLTNINSYIGNSKGSTGAAIFHKNSFLEINNDFKTFDQRIGYFKNIDAIIIKGKKNDIKFKFNNAKKRFEFENFHFILTYDDIINFSINNINKIKVDLYLNDRFIIKDKDIIIKDIDLLKQKELLIN